MKLEAGRVTFALTVAIVGAPLECFAANIATPADGSPAAVEEPTQSAPPSPAELEAAIKALGEPIDYEQLNRIFSDLGRLEDPKEQQRLQQLLEARMRELTELPDASPMLHPNPGAEMTDEALMRRIDRLNLGPEATADDLRARDEVVSAIVGITDPIQRDWLLRHLEERERQADTDTSVPTPQN